MMQKKLSSWFTECLSSLLDGTPKSFNKKRTLRNLPKKEHPDVKQFNSLFDNAARDPFLGVPLVGYKDIVCGDESSEDEPLENFIK